MTFNGDGFEKAAARGPASNNLSRYYLLRAVVAGVWVAAAVAASRSDAAAIALLLLVAYPAWDAAANWFDAHRNGGLHANPSQASNIAISLVAAAAIAVAAQSGMNAVLAVFGVWAMAAGLGQLITGVRRWPVFGAQWAMILSGTQSMLAGAFFVSRARLDKAPTIVDVAPYAAFGAFYFLVSAGQLVLADRWRTA